MQYINSHRLRELNSAEFRQQQPFPFMNIQSFLTDEGFRELCQNLPPISMFHKEFGKKRGYGQDSHDRWVLQYRDGLDIPACWQAFIDELKSPAYSRFIRQMYALSPSDQFVFTMHWHMAPAGCSVSPHVDASRKQGSHIFYLHERETWNPEWGGQTVVLDDGGRFPVHSSHPFEDFREVAASNILDNQSFIFERTDNSWHGVRPIACPDGQLRKVFIVVINRLTLQVRWRQLRGKDADGYPLRERSRHRG